jgi:predicted RNase H-like HicB family nuclease
METMITLHVEQLSEGYYLATSSDVQGLVAQGRTIAETLEIARDVARRLIEAKAEKNTIESLRPVGSAFDLQVVVGC